jgi:adenine/guanine/hypoxanthine permease
MEPPLYVSNPLSNYFGLEQPGTTWSREMIAGATTFVTMSYMVVANPAVLKGAGIPAEPSLVATILTATFGTLLMGVSANRPCAIAPYRGENAFITYTVVQVLGFRWQTALAAVFVAAAIFLLLTVLSLRQWLVEAVPPSLRYSFVRWHWAVSLCFTLTHDSAPTHGNKQRGATFVEDRV